MMLQIKSEPTKKKQTILSWQINKSSRGLNYFIISDSVSVDFSRNEISADIDVII